MIKVKRKPFEVFQMLGFKDDPRRRRLVIDTKRNELRLFTKHDDHPRLRCIARISVAAVMNFMEGKS